MPDRTFYRLRFPRAAALSFIASQGEFPICELSEGGLRIICDAGSGLHVGQPVQGTMILSSGDRIDVKGLAVRREDDELVITQAAGVTFQHMMSEQRNLVQKFPRGIAPAPPATDPQK